MFGLTGREPSIMDCSTIFYKPETGLLADTGISQPGEGSSRENGQPGDGGGEKIAWDAHPYARGAAGLGLPLQLPIDDLDGRSFQQWVIRQPVKSGGFGLISKVEVIPAAFIGGLEQALPHFYC